MKRRFHRLLRRFTEGLARVFDSKEKSGVRSQELRHIYNGTQYLNAQQARKPRTLRLKTYGELLRFENSKIPAAIREQKLTTCVWNPVPQCRAGYLVMERNCDCDHARIP
ncbi:hypothetical protein Tco_0246035 [Tanacetum coccineum]